VWKIIAVIMTALGLFVLDEHVIMPYMFQNIYWPWALLFSIIIIALELFILYYEIMTLLYSD